MAPRPRPSWSLRPAPPASTCSRSPTTTPPPAGTRRSTPPARSASSWCAGWRSAPTHRGHSVHLLAYLPDPGYAPLVAELDSVLGGRRARVPEMLSRLRDLGIDIDEDDVRRASHGTAATGRPHVADALVTQGRRGRPHRGLRPLPGLGPPRSRRALRRRAGRRPRSRQRRGRGERDRPPLGAQPTPVPRPRRPRRAAGPTAWPASRSTTRTTTPPPAPSCAAWPASSTWWSPAPATTTAPARSTTSSASTPRIPTSTPGSSTWPPSRPRAADARPLKWYARELCPRHGPGRRGLRDPVRDHGPGRHDPDLLVAHQRPRRGVRPARRPSPRSWCRSS